MIIKNFIRQNLCSLVFLTLIVVFILSAISYFPPSRKTDSFNNMEATDCPQVEATPSSQAVASQQKRPSFIWTSAEGLITENCEYKSNNYMAECAMGLLDRKAAEREWKQRKMEAWDPGNKNNIMDFEGSKAKIAAWRNGFEKAEKDWCEANTSTFDWGSGRPYDMAHCMLSFELAAIDDLNSIYYEEINSEKSIGEVIKDFEPTDADIDALVKINIISPEYVWSG